MLPLLYFFLSSVLLTALSLETLGERQGLDYVGPLNPLIQDEGSATGRESIINGHIPHEQILDLSALVSIEGSCLPKNLKENLENYKYLWRLISLSVIERSYGVSELKACKAKGPIHSEMKKLQSRLQEQRVVGRSSHHSLVKNLCSESSMGLLLKRDKELAERLFNSHLGAFIQSNWGGHSCFLQFLEEKKKSFTPYDKGIFDKGVKRILSSKKSNPFGPTFFMGSLQEFDRAGISGIFFKPLVKKSTKPQGSKVRKSTAATPVVDDNRKKALVKKRSTFFKAWQKMTKTGVEYVDVNMKNYKQDMAFTEGMSKLLGPLGNKFFNKKALRKMKRQDQAGSITAPFDLYLIHFFIQRRPELIKNITDILGREIYVSASISENIDTPVRIKILEEKQIRLIR